MIPLGTSWKMISNARDYRSQIRQLVDWASDKRILDDLLRVALDANPHSASLRALNEATGLIPATSALVEAIRPVLPEVDVKAWTRAMVGSDETNLRRRNHGAGKTLAFSPLRRSTPSLVFSSSVCGANFWQRSAA